MTLLVGDGLDDALAALDAEGARRAAELAHKLRDTRKIARAQALAAAAQEIAVAIDEVTLR